MKRLMVTLIAALVALGAFADTWTDTDIGYTWTYRIYGGMAEIYNGGGSCAISPSPTGAVAIPSTLGGRPVTGIGYCAFYNCNLLKLKIGRARRPAEPQLRRTDLKGTMK